MTATGGSFGCMSPMAAEARSRWLRPAPRASVEECNHVEEGAAVVAFEGSSFRVALGPFQIRTFRLRF